MINFFRRIRNLPAGKAGNMADDNRPLKYMRYAIGEIVLVVIGILIALQINNWNERQKGIGEMKIYLNEVLQDLKKDKEYIESVMLKHDSVLVKYSNYDKKFNDSTQIQDIVGLQVEAMSGNKIIIFPSSTTVEKVSRVDHIDNHLRRKLLELKIEQERLKRINEEDIKLQNETIQIARNNGWNGHLATMASSHQELSNFLKYDERWPDLIMIVDGWLEQKFFSSKQAIIDLKKIDQRLDKIIELIEQELTP